MLWDVAFRRKCAAPDEFDKLYCPNSTILECSHLIIAKYISLVPLYADPVFIAESIASVDSVDAY